MLQVDANGAYNLKDMETLKALDAFDLLMVEQPFAPYDLWDHAKLQREMKTPVCLDEIVVSFDTARAALEMGSCRVINIKVGRVGGVVETRRIHDFCESRGVPVWCGGMLESGIGRAHNLHIATLPDFKYPNDSQRQPALLQRGPDRPVHRAERPGHDPRPRRAGHRRQSRRIPHRPGLPPPGGLQIRRGQTYTFLIFAPLFLDFGGKVKKV